MGHGGPKFQIETGIEGSHGIEDGKVATDAIHKGWFSQSFGTQQCQRVWRGVQWHHFEGFGGEVNEPRS